jgi:hypothetical protein
MGIRAYRLDPTSRFHFHRAGCGGPAAVQFGSIRGITRIEFAYPKSYVNSRPLRSRRGPAPELAPAALPEAPQVVTADRALEPELPAIAAALEETITVPTPELPAPVAETDTNAETLPQTSSNLAMLPLAGLALLFGGFAAVRFAVARG